MALTDSLSAYWKLDEASGNATDAHGSSTLTDNNTVGSTTGKVGNARTFVASSSEYLSSADNAALSLGNFDWTVTAWVRLASKGSGDPGIVCKGDEYFIYWRSGTDRFNVELFGSTGFGSGGGVTASSFGAPSTGVWYFLVVWYDSVANTINISVNDGATNSSPHAAGSHDGGGTFAIGHDGYGSYWTGDIDEVGVWKRALTSGERTELYNAGAGLAYPFGGGDPPATRVSRLALLGVG